MTEFDIEAGIGKLNTKGWTWP